MGNELESTRTEISELQSNDYIIMDALTTKNLLTCKSNHYNMQEALWHDTLNFVAVIRRKEKLDN